MYFSYNASSMWFPDLLLYFKLVSNTPYGGKFPAIMIFDLLAQTLHIHIERIIGNIFASAIPNGITQHLARDELTLMLEEEE